MYPRCLRFGKMSGSSSRAVRFPPSMLKLRFLAATRQHSGRQSVTAAHASSVRTEKQVDTRVFPFPDFIQRFAPSRAVLFEPVHPDAALPWARASLGIGLQTSVSVHCLALASPAIALLIESVGLQATVTTPVGCGGLRPPTKSAYRYYQVVPAASGCTTCSMPHLLLSSAACLLILTPTVCCICMLCADIALAVDLHAVRNCQSCLRQCMAHCTA